MPKSVPSKVSYVNVDAVVEDNEDEDEIANEEEKVVYSFHFVPNGCCCKERASSIPARRRTKKLEIPVIKQSYLWNLIVKHFVDASIFCSRAFCPGNFHIFHLQLLPMYSGSEPG